MEKQLQFMTSRFFYGQFRPTSYCILLVVAFTSLCLVGHYLLRPVRDFPVQSSDYPSAVSAMLRRRGLCARQHGNKRPVGSLAL